MIDEIQNPFELHICLPPGDYVAPRGLIKLLYQSAVYSDSRRSSLAHMMKILHDTRVVCGSCGTAIDCRLWRKSEIRRLCGMARLQGLRQLEDAMCRDYDSQRPTCRNCGHSAPLAHVKLPFFEDVIIAERSDLGRGPLAKNPDSLA